MFWFVPYISDPAKPPRDGASDTPHLLIAFSHNVCVYQLWVNVLPEGAFVLHKYC